MSSHPLCPAAACLAVGLTVAWVVPTHAAEFVEFRITGNVLADNHVFYTGSPNVDFTLLEDGFNKLPEMSTGSQHCPLKNFGEREPCDGDVGNVDLAFWAATLGPLTYQGESSDLQVRTYQDGEAIFTRNSFLYIAAWTDGNQGFLADLELRRTRSNNSPKLIRSLRTQPSPNWTVCSTGIPVTPGKRPDTATVLGAIGVCDSPDIPNWKEATSITPPVSRSDFGSAQWVWSPDTAEPNHVVVLRHELALDKVNLSTSVEDLGDSVRVTVDPPGVASFQLDLEFGLDQVMFDENQPGVVTGVPPFVVPAFEDGGFEFDPVTQMISNIIGQSPIATLPFSGDIFQVVFQKVDPGLPLEAFDFRVSADADDFIEIVASEPDATSPTLRGDEIKPIAVGPLFFFDLNRNDEIEPADIILACNEGEILTPWLSRLQFTLGDIDFDGQVTFQDFLRASINVGLEGTYAEGDVNCDTRIDTLDTDIIVGDIGQVAAAATVPEPSTQLILSAGGLLLSFARRPYSRCHRRNQSAQLKLS